MSPPTPPRFRGYRTEPAAPAARCCLASDASIPERCQVSAERLSPLEVAVLPIEPPPDAEKRQAMPLPRDLPTLLLAGILSLLTLFTLYAASEVLLPVVSAIILKLVLQPSMRTLARLKLPKPVAALLLMALLFGTVAALGTALAGPAAEWVAKAPETLPQLERRLSSYREPVEAMQRATEQVETLAAGSTADRRVVAVAGPGLGSVLFSGTRALLAGVLTTVVLLYFLLVSGDLFLRRIVEILPTLTDKKQAVEISREIETNISGYLGTISMMNAAVGLGTGLATYLCGLSDPILWGTLAFLLNYVPILGPLFGVAILFVAGLLTFAAISRAALPAGTYLVIHFIESQAVTPVLLARRFSLNPVLVIISLVFWFWLWGVPGALLAVPMLATAKIVCDRVRPLMALGHFLGAEPRS
jgi:predicted PurR-regulated permease PerM